MMTDQPKFQRRKRRSAVTEAAQDVRPIETSEAEVQALLAEKEALLQRTTELEAKRLRAELAKREAEVEAKQDTPNQENLAEVAPARIPAKPLVLAAAPDPKPTQSIYDSDGAWKGLDRFSLDAQLLAKHNVITALQNDPAHSRFDILRTRMLQALKENGWRRVAITSPTKDCGKTFTAANLAISLSRQDNCRAVLLDLDMRSPSLHKIFGVKDPGAIGDMLRDEIAPTHHLQGFGANEISAGSRVAIGFNGLVEPYAAELLQDPTTEQVLQNIESDFEPDVMLFDLPPALMNDDVLAMRPHFDALLIVAAGGTTKAHEIKETELRLGDKVPLLGVVLNKSEDADTGDYGY